MVRQTCLFEEHQALGAKLVDFHGWQMPLHYGSQLDEHRAVRQCSGMFDVSHMTILEVSGTDAEAYLSVLLANDVGRLRAQGAALYSLMLNKQGGILDDLIVFRLSEPGAVSGRFRLVTNCATHDDVTQWMREQAIGLDVVLCEQAGLAMIAVQGPQAALALAQVLDMELTEQLESLSPFSSFYYQNLFISGTGYTGENGFEVTLPAVEAPQLWRALLKAGVQPCGLGARDTLRMEAGMMLYGQDMDTSTTPMTVGLAWTIAWQPEERMFNGRVALETLRAHRQNSQLYGLVVAGPNIPRTGMQVVTDLGPGKISSGVYSPTLACGIALAHLPCEASQAEIEIRGHKVAAQLVRPPFIRHGKQTFS